MKVVQKKICMLGSFAVGKTSLVRRFVEGRFDDKYLSTIGTKISRKTLIRPDYTLNLLLWDLAGGDKFPAVRQSYLRGAAGALIVCDLTRAETLADMERYAELMRSVEAQAVLIFAGNKADLETRAITGEQLAQACAPWGPWLLTSAKTGLNVEAAFVLLAEQLEN